MKQTGNKTEARWSAEQIKASSKFIHRRDVLNAVLQDGETYTVSEVEDLIDNYMKGGVE